ncbi:hypothetical protein C2S52_018077 [Perilla frutescens var. hirtella]|uniref:Uncharacterized protein n=1 Tax=Perilla frutescens var. hirtella TaxID=608512 RepID=A0AAD4JJ01_PERFH|nr:hypothetical protein C2S52_018077 [Perilla frutescens var. hirtella]KAH6834336.1 hypothetical protein C2S53_012083 [Perilla frutescens var. hirtella]
MGKTSARSDGKPRKEHKFEKKVQFYGKVRASVAEKAISKEKQQKKRSRQKKLRVYDMSSLTECLPELKASLASEPAELKLNCKRRNDLVLKESNKLKMVFNHPVYQSDPLAAIYQHLQMTQPATEEKPKGKDGKKRKSKAKKKKSTATESMDI